MIMYTMVMEGLKAFTPPMEMLNVTYEHLTPTSGRA